MSNQGKRPDEVEFNTIVGKNIRYLRKSKKLTQSNLADAIGVACQQVSKYELGSNWLHSYSLYKVARKVLNVSMDVLTDPQMIIKYEGFKDKNESHEYKTLGEEITKDQMDAALSKAKAEGYLEPKVIVGSLEKIKDQLKKDGIDPEKTITTLKKAAQEKVKYDVERRMVFDPNKYEEFEEEYPAPLSQLENDPKMRATYDAIIDARKKRH